MKKNTVIIIYLIIALLISAQPPTISDITEDTQNLIHQVAKTNIRKSGQMRIMSYNLLADSAGFNGTTAFERADGVCSIINCIKPDIIGLQEVSRNWYYCLKSNTKYKFIRPLKTALFGTMTTIIYNPDTVSLLSCGETSFTSTPQSQLRQMVWGIFSRKTDNTSFCIINTHLSLSNEDWDIAIKQAKELAEEINQLSNNYHIPVFVTGDFNSGKRKTYNTDTAGIYETICTVADDTKNISRSSSCGDGKSFQSVAIDHIFMRGDAVVDKYTILSQREFAVLSDHYPIFVDFSLLKNE